MTAMTHDSFDRPHSWRYHAMALSAFVFLIGIEFYTSLYAALQVWIVSPTYSHCFLIIPIVLWLIWEKRDALAMVRPVVAPRYLWLVPFLGALWWVGELSAVNEICQYAVIALMQVMIVTFLGTQILRIIWFPVLFLLFLVPTGEYLIFPMQQFATRFVDVCLNVLNIAHYTEGTTLELTNGRFEIAEACAGLRFLIATVTLGVLYTYLMYNRVYKVLLFLVASVAIPLIGNGLRCVGIILLAHFTNNKYGAGADHIIYGWGFNVAILLTLIFLGSLFRDHPKETVLPRNVDRRHDTFRRLATVIVAAGVLVSIGPAFALWRDTRPTRPNMSMVTDYLQAGGWHEMKRTDDWSPHFPGADAEVIVSKKIATDSPPVDFFIEYYARPGAGHTVTAHLNLAWNNKDWMAAETGFIPARLGPQLLRLQETVINSGAQKRLIWSSYWLDDRFTLSLVNVKLLQAKAALEGRDGQAFVALSTPVDGPVEEARARLGTALSRLGALPPLLNRVETEASVGPR
jgi:exosortase A